MSTIRPTVITPCPHCFEEVQIDEINCGIFRHAVYKHNMEGINPHASKEECDKLLNEEKIYGCGKPFKIEKNNEGRYIAVICDYI